MQKIFCLLPVLLVSGIVGVDSLQCYVCDNCPSPTEADLSSCDDPVTVTPTQTTATPASTTATPPATTATPASTTATPASTTAAPASTTAAPAPTTAAPASTTAAPVPSGNTDPSVRRFKRSILSLANSTKTGCDCKNEIGCNCDDNLSRVSTYTDYVCFKAVLKKDNMIVRGCVPATLDNKPPCELEDVVAVVNSCRTCDTDQCNGSYMLQFSIYMLAATISVILFK